MLAKLIEQRFGAGAGTDVSDLHPFFERVLSRGSARDFKADPVSDDLFHLLAAVALSASSKSDLQQVSIIDVEAADQRDAVAKLVPSINWVRTAPRFIIFCGDARRIEKIARIRGVALDNANVEGFLNATIDAALVLQTFLLAAEAAGLGGCPVSNLRYRGEELAQILGLPNRVFPVAGLAIGYPAMPPKIKPRLPLSLTVHRDRYDDSLEENAVDAYDLRHGAGEDRPEKHWSYERSRHPELKKAAAFARYLARTGFPFAAGPAGEHQEPT